MKKRLLTFIMILATVFGIFAIANKGSNEAEAANTDVWGMIGTMNGWNTSGITSDYETKFNASTGNHELTVKLEKGAEFKFLLKGNGYSWSNKQCHVRSWENNLGTQDTDIKSYFEGSDNFKCKVAGTYKFSIINEASTYGDCEWGLSVEPVVEKTAAEKVAELTTIYYNNGSYTRNTEIFFNEAAKKEATLYFHAQCTILTRTTYFNGNELWMSTEENADGQMVYSYYGSQGGNLTWTHTLEKQVTPTSYSTAIKGTSMETYYVTMDDIKSLNVSWTESNGVYTSTDAAAKDAFLAFTAPCFLNTNQENANYLSLAKVTVQETSEGLVLCLYTTGDDGKLTNSNNLLSKAVITK